ncbi:MAG TPA: hypothetical protein EYP98_18395 [Planctomycetes bacterium]|nr:hypothetical protein [Planctomycetota bacterium]
MPHRLHQPGKGMTTSCDRDANALSETARACLLLHVVLDLSFAEIAVMLEIPENTAMSHARRARVALRAALSPPAASRVRR